ncbi:MAG: hypothetical protein QM238_07295, partial [Bacteroidota bacterium]|nr:hypothetical protein [Bacteroidota bacterium]
MGLDYRNLKTGRRVQIMLNSQPAGRDFTHLYVPSCWLKLTAIRLYNQRVRFGSKEGVSKGHPLSYSMAVVCMCTGSFFHKQESREGRLNPAFVIYLNHHSASDSRVTLKDAPHHLL